MMMEKKLVMPKLRPEMEKGVLCAWLKDEGAEVKAGEPIYEIETDKVVNQIEATDSGVLKKQLCEEGDTVDALAPVAILETK
jgi:pyruvate/2-oxoglutarate dehydrogenase complex dihydrolipoamide acyltransferase (E2) component